MIKEGVFLPIVSISDTDFEVKYRSDVIAVLLRTIAVLGPLLLLGFILKGPELFSIRFGVVVIVVWVFLIFAPHFGFSRVRIVDERLDFDWRGIQNFRKKLSVPINEIASHNPAKFSKGFTELRLLDGRKFRVSMTRMSVFSLFMDNTERRFQSFLDSAVQTNEHLDR